MALTSGVYSGTLIFTAVTNHVPEPPTPIITPPPGTDPPNISLTNPAVLDVYPTTGWVGDTIAITSNSLFTNVTSVTTPCTNYTVVTASLIACVLPAKTAETSNNIAVTNHDTETGVDTNVTDTDASNIPYTHMNIIYFNPNSSTVTMANNGVTYNYYPNGFTNTNCSALTPNNSSITSTPNTSMAYFRDTRNNQAYKVKRMADNECWMVDNLKYIDNTITNTADGTTGMVYNNGDHRNNGGSDAANTVDESTTQSTANSDKAFFNNPIQIANCYNGTNMPANTLTNCGYLYNWYAATNGTGIYSLNTSGNQSTGSICPSNFRLPSGTSGMGGPTTNGTAVTVADIPVLNASINAGTLATGTTTSNATHATNWQSTGSWGGTYSGTWLTGLGTQGNSGYFWSSTATSAPYAGNLYFVSGNVHPDPSANRKLNGFGVRCVLMP